MSAPATKPAERLRKVLHRASRPWSDYPLGSFALGKEGGRWERTAEGWQWCYGGVSDAPTAKVSWVMVPTDCVLPKLEMSVRHRSGPKGAVS